MKTSGHFVPQINILFSYIENLLPSVMTCYSHFHGVIACLSNNYLCFKFLSIFPYKLSDTFFYRNVIILVKLTFQTRRKMCIRVLKRNGFAGYVLCPEKLFNSLVFYPRDTQIPTPALISHLTYFDLFPSVQIVRWPLFLEDIFRWVSS